MAAVGPGSPHLLGNRATCPRRGRIQRSEMAGRGSFVGVEPANLRHALAAGPAGEPGFYPETDPLALSSGRPYGPALEAARGAEIPGARLKSTDCHAFGIIVSAFEAVNPAIHPPPDPEPAALPRGGKEGGSGNPRWVVSRLRGAPLNQRVRPLCATGIQSARRGRPGQRSWLPA